MLIYSFIYPLLQPLKQKERMSMWVCQEHDLIMVLPAGAFVQAKNAVKLDYVMGELAPKHYFQLSKWKQKVQMQK